MIKINVKKTGKDSIATIHKWFDDFTKGISNTKSLWEGLTPDIKKQIDLEFSDSNPNGWDNILASTKATKVSKGFPETIGVATGSLKNAAGQNAKVTYKKLGIDWELNDRITSGQYGSLKSTTVGEYAKYFNENREIFVYTSKWLTKVGRQAVKEYIKKSAGKASK